MTAARTGSERIGLMLQPEEVDQVSIIDGLCPSFVERWGRDSLPPDHEPGAELGFEFATDRPNTSPWQPIMLDGSYSCTPDGPVVYGSTLEKHRDALSPARLHGRHGADSD